MADALWWDQSYSEAVSWMDVHRMFVITPHILVPRVRQVVQKAIALMASLRRFSCHDRSRKSVLDVSYMSPCVARNTTAEGTVACNKTRNLLSV